MESQKDYQKGYAAGKRRAASEKADLIRTIDGLKKALVIGKESQRERVFMRALEMVVANCNGWSIGGKEIANANGYCQLADVFTKHSIEQINRLNR